MESVKKLALCLGLAVLVASPLSGCSGTWNGMKNDWHNMTSSNDEEQQAPQTVAQAPQGSQSVSQGESSGMAPGDGWTTN